MNIPIKVNKIKEKEVTLYSPDDCVVGVISNVLEFNDVRLQIFRKKLEGYYVKWNGEKVEINKFGGYDTSKTQGLFDMFDDQINELIGLI